MEFREEERGGDTSIVKYALDQFITEQRDIYKGVLAEVIAGKPAVVDIRCRAGPAIQYC